jgi:hypothetical protein
MLTGVEDRYLQGWNRYAQFFNPAPNAAQFSKSQIRNPVGSGVLAVVEQVIVGGTLTDTPSFVVFSGTTDLTTASATVNRIDARGSQSPALRMSLGTTVAGTQAGATWLVAFTANTSVQLIIDPNQEITILPGDIFQITSGVVNQALFMTVVWRERVLEPSELS